MKKSLLCFLGGMASVFAVIGLFILFIVAAAALFENTMTSDNKSHITVLAENESPNKKHIATVYSSMGGGAAGYCDAEVTVRNSEEEFDDNKFVFSSHCGTKIKTEWENNERLHISYSSDDSIQSLTQKAWNADKSVRIIYQEK